MSSMDGRSRKLIYSIKSWLLLTDNQNDFVEIPSPFIKLLQTSTFLQYFLKKILKMYGYVGSWSLP